MNKIIELIYKLALLSLFFLVPNVANAITKGEELYAGIKDFKAIVENHDGNAMSAGIAAGYIAGLLRGFQLTEGKYQLCPPPSVTNAENVDIVFNYLEDHPEERRLGSDVLIFKSFADVYHCPEKSNAPN